VFFLAASCGPLVPFVSVPAYGGRKIIKTALKLGATVWSIVSIWLIAVAGTEIAIALVIAAAVVVAAWVIPVWWIINWILSSVETVLTDLATAVFKEELSAERYFVEVRERGASWLAVAADWGMERYQAPALVRRAAPEVIDILSPLLDEPLEVGLGTIREETFARLGRWKKRVRWLRLGAGLLLLAPFVIVPFISIVY